LYSPFLCRLNSPQVATIARIVLRLLKRDSIDRNPSSFKLRVVPTELRKKKKRKNRKGDPTVCRIVKASPEKTAPYMLILNEQTVRLPSQTSESR